MLMHLMSVSLFYIFSGSISCFLFHNTQHAMFQHEADMINEDFLYFGYLTQTFHAYINCIAFFFECFFPVFGNLYLACFHEEERV